jgi:hypothetical protein
MSHTDPPAPRCEHGARWGDCYHCWAETAAAIERAAEQIDTVQNMSEAERARLRQQIDATHLPTPWGRKGQK